MDGTARLERLRREAEAEMRRAAPADFSSAARPSKRARREHAGPAPASADFIHVDRFHYAMVNELEAGVKGFLITTHFRKEKSATREASNLLRRYMPTHLFPAPPAPAAAAATASEQPNKPEAGAAGREHASGSDSGSDCDEEDGGGGGANVPEAPPAEPAAFGLAKVSCRGVVLMRLSPAAAAAVDPVHVVASLLRDIEAKALPQPTFCQRIVPLDSTCELTPRGLARGMAQAAAAYSRRQPQRGQGQEPAGEQQVPGGSGAAAAAVPPFTYAIAYRSRTTEAPGGAPADAAGRAGAAAGAGSGAGAAAAPVAAAAAAAARPADAAAEPPPPPEAAAAATPEAAAAGQPAADAGGGSGQPAPGPSAAQPAEAPPPPPPPQSGEGDASADAVLAERGRIITLVAAGMDAAFGEGARVNLKKPQVAVFVEAVPVAGRTFAGLAVLGEALFQAKGKLLVRPLIKNAPANA